MHATFTFDYVDRLFICVMVHRSASGRDHANKLSNPARANLRIHQEFERAVACGSRRNIAFAHGPKRFGILLRAHNRVYPNLGLFVLRATYADYLDITDAASPLVKVLDLIDAAWWNINRGPRLERIAMSVNETSARSVDYVDHFFANRIASCGRDPFRIGTDVLRDVASAHLPRDGSAIASGALRPGELVGADDRSTTE